MKLTFKKAFKIACDERVKYLNQMINRVKELTETKYNLTRIENTLLDLFYSTREVSLSLYDDKTLIYRADIANNRIFYIKLTDEEIKEKRLYIGHRFFPFINPFLASTKLNIFDSNSEKYSLGRLRISHEKAYKYILFQVLHFLDKGDPDDNGLLIDYIKLDSLLSGKEKECNFKVTITDFYKNDILLEKLSNKEFAEYSLLCRNGDKFIHDEILKVLKQTGDFGGIDDILQTVFNELTLAKMPRFNSIANVLNSQNDFKVDHSMGVTTLSIIEDDTARKIITNPDITPGLAKDFDGIMNEMGLTLTEDFIYSLMFEMIYNDEFDFQWILMDLIEIELRIENDKQFDNLQKAFTKLANRVLKDVDTTKVSKTDMNSLAKYNDSTLQIVFFLRDIDIKFGNSENFDVNQLVPLLEIDKLLEAIYSKFRHKKKFTVDERKSAKDVYDGVKMVIDSLKDRLF